MEQPTTARRHLIIGSSVAFVIGATIMIFLHECAHAVAGAVFGYRPTQLPFAVDYTPVPPTNVQIIALLAGPAFSLLSGFLGVAIDRVVRPFQSRPFWRLVWLWTVFASLQEGFGYLQIAALIQAGDTGQALTLMAAPPVAFILTSVVGWACLPLTAWIFSKPIREMSTSVGDRRDLTVWPWMIGTGGMLILMTLYVIVSPAVGAGAVFAVLAGAVAIGVYAPMSMMFGGNRAEATSLQLPWPPTAGLVLLGVLVVGNIVLTRGWLW